VTKHGLLSYLHMYIGIASCGLHTCKWLQQPDVLLCCCRKVPESKAHNSTIAITDAVELIAAKPGHPTHNVSCLGTLDGSLTALRVKPERSGRGKVAVSAA
jgi:hypothetical protein